jgi:dTDP-4-amino-4,6-dideoxygalactose transaminase
MRTEYLPFFIPEVGEEEIGAVIETLRSGWLTTGTRVRDFETSFAAYLGAQHAIAVNSCTAALHLALDAIDLNAGDEVLIPTMTFAATGEVVLYMGARPVLVDCDPVTLNLDVEDVERKITPRTRAIIPVHFAGQPCEMDRILAVAKQYQLKVVEDAAHALPARYGERTVGTISDITCFSFYANKTITTGEGGMITTANSSYAERMRLMSLHGISKDAWKRYSRTGAWRYEIERAGYKYNMTDIAAAIGRAQLAKCERFWETRRRYAALYDDGFADLPEIIRPVEAQGVQHAWHLYAIQLDLARLRIGRDEFIERLREANIGTSVHFIPLHLHPLYRKTYGYRPEDFPCATAVSDRNISLPLFPKMSGRDVADVVEAIRAIVEKCRR